MTAAASVSTTSAPLAGLLRAVQGDAYFAAIAENVDAITRRITGPHGVRPFVTATIAAQDRPVLLVVATGREAEAATAAIGDLIGADRVMIFPSWETLPHERLSPRADTVGRRLAVLRRLAHPEEHPAGLPAVIVATIRSVIQPMAPDLGEITPVTVRLGDEVDLSELVQRLVDLAYTRVEIVEKRGEIAVRGGILDVFPPTAEHPVRVEFWGDEVTDLRTFAVTDQRSLDQVEALVAAPCREILLTDDVRERAAALSAKATGDRTLAEMLDKLASGVGVEGMESLLPALMPGRLDVAHRSGPGAHPRAAGRPRADPAPRRGPGPHRAGVPGRFLDGRGHRRSGTDRPGRLGVPRAGRRAGHRPGPRAADLVPGPVRPGRCHHARGDHRTGVSG